MIWVLNWHNFSDNSLGFYFFFIWSKIGLVRAIYHCACDESTQGEYFCKVLILLEKLNFLKHHNYRKFFAYSPKTQMCQMWSKII